MHQLFFRGLQIHGDDVALNQLGDLCADHVGAEELAGLLVEDHLDQALVLAERDRLAVTDEGEAADADLAATLLGLGFGEADGGHLRLAIGAARDQVLVHGMRVQALDRLDADHAFMLGLVREHRGTRDVADGIDAGDVGVAVAVDHDDAAIGFDAELFEAEILDIADDADRRDHPLELGRDRLALAVVDGGDDAVGLLLQLRDLGRGHDLDALLLETLAGKAGDLGVLDRQDLRQHLDHGDLGAHGVEERGEFDSDRAGADHQQRFRHPLGHHRLEIGPDQLLVGLEPRQHARPRAGRHDDVFCLISSLAQRALRTLDVGLLHGDLPGRVDRCGAPDHADLVLLHQEADAVVEPLRDAARALHHRLRVERHFLRRQAVIPGVLHVVIDLGRAQQRLGRDATPVQADAAEIGFFDDRDLEAELGGADRGDIAAGTGADDDDVEGCIGHALRSFPFNRPQCSRPSLRGALATKQSSLPVTSWIASLRSQSDDANFLVTPSS
ncbi:hypothetical protein ACVWZZ_008728 [Bradyrhizobium sp. LM6.10]